MTDQFERDESNTDLQDVTTRSIEFGSLGIGLILFVLGVAIGFPLAMIGTSFLTDNAGAIVAVVITVTVIITLFGAVLLMFRRHILSYLFNITTDQLEQFSRPLSQTARHIVDRQAGEAVNSAEELTKLLLARWTWVATRRWLIGSLTGLLAALAALAGTALLFRQNELLETQLVRLDQQNGLLTTQIELGEAQRSAGIIPELLNIGEQLADETETLKQDGRPAAQFNLIELSNGLRGRVIAASQATRPYRYLKTSAVDSLDTGALQKLAISRRPEIIADAAVAAELEALRNDSSLHDRPTSPERGILLAMLFGAGVYETEQLTFFGADFAFAEVRIPTLNVMTFQFARLRFATFDLMALNALQFGGAELDHARFRKSVIKDTSFAGLTEKEVKPPYAADPSLPVFRTNLAGADFVQAQIYSSRFDSINGLAMNFDDALISETSFKDASIGGSTFPGQHAHRCRFHRRFAEINRFRPRRSSLRAISWTG